MNDFLITYILVVAAILIGLLGAILLTIGLILKKRPLWISGIVGLSLGLILFLSGLFFGFSKLYLFLNKNSKTGHYKNYYTDDYTTTNSDTTVAIADTTESTTQKISGCIAGKNNISVFVTIMNSNELTKKGVELVKIEKSGHSNTQKKVISVKINFNSDSGNIRLTAYDINKSSLGSAEMKMNVRKSKGYIIDFYFPASTNFSLVDYCILSE